MRSLVILAAGTGSRMELGYNKVFYKLKNNKSILETTIDIFYENNLFSEIIVVYNEEDKAKVQEEIKTYKRVKLVPGDEERYLSVSKGIEACENEIVYVHDSARCNFNPLLVNKIEEEVQKGYKCLTFAVPCKDTTSFKTTDNVICQSLERSNLVSIQTPQVFYKSEYQKIFNGKPYTDESTLFFENEYEVKIVFGEYHNFKITTMEDLKYYEYLKFIQK